MAAPTFDVQRALAAMADYPALLRRVGAVRVLRVTRAQLAAAGVDLAGGPVTISARPVLASTRLPAAQVDLTPMVTPAFLSATRFALTADGRVDPAAAGLTVAEVDVDGAAIQLVDLARQVVRAEVANGAAAAADPPRLPPVDLPDRMALPALRNAGLSVVQGDRAVDLRRRLIDGRPLVTAAGSAPMPLSDASHATKGVVVDVWDDRTRRWRTLCARRGVYQLPGGASFTLDDEGAISMAASAAMVEDADRMRAPMYLHQSMLRWTGFSLVASRPGQPVVTEDVDPGNPDDRNTNRAPLPPTGPGLPGFTVTFTPQPGSLPTLRFGRGYRFRLRTVDLVGRADPLDPASTDFTRAVPAPPASPARYLRFDPVDAPIVVATAPMTEGESIDTVVVRPDPWLGGLVGSLLAPILGTPPSRHLAPPKVTQTLCEEHGMFDDAQGRPDARRYAEIARGDAADLQTVGTPDPRRAGQRYVEGNLAVAWLPDPLSRGAALSGLPGGVVKIPFGAWPSPRAFRLQLVDGTGQPSWNAFTRILTVRVPRGETRRVRLSSYVDPPDTALLGQVGWLQAGGAPASVVSAATADVVAGRSWQVTPYRELTLVNAVRVPVAPPHLVSITGTPGRTLGSTVQRLAATAEVHRPSTGTLSLRATWTDPVDDPTQGPPREVVSVATPPLDSGGGLAPELTVGADPDPVSGAQVGFTGTQTFADTRRHVVGYRPTATTRYMEYFTQRGTVTLRDTTPVEVARAGIVPGSDTVRSPDGATAYRRGMDYVLVPPEAPRSVARTAQSRIPSGTSVEIAVVALPVSAAGVGVPLAVDVPSSTRPLPPQVGWIVPSFGWTESSSNFNRNRRRIRAGGGLRIFLDRPWFSSGIGEQLGVVLADGPAPTGAAAALVTQLGADPVVVGESPVAFPAAADFPLATQRRGGLTPPGAAGTVAVAGHDVVYDTERERWTCDVVLPPGRAYHPLVRLRLARFQPGSVDGVHLSALAAVEWAQLAPDRTATVLLDLLDLTKVTVTVAGRASGGTAEAAGPTTMSVIVQTSDEFDPADLDWRTAGPPDGTPLAASQQGDGTTLWTGTLRLPGNRLLRPHRVVVVEHQRFTGGRTLVYSDVLRL